MLIECVASVNRSSFCVNCWRQDTINCWPSLEAHVFYRTSSRESAQKRLALAARLLVQFTSRRKSWYLDVILFYAFVFNISAGYLMRYIYEFKLDWF